MFTFLVIVISLSIIILFHEGGHFIFSRLVGIKVEEFGFGYPPRIIGIVKIKSTKKWKIFFGKRVPPIEEIDSTIYSLNWIPFGGFNKIKGEEEENKEPDSFFIKPWWQKFLSLIGGAIMNIVLAIIIFSICFNVGIPSIAEKKELGKGIKITEVGIQIVSLYKSSPAEKAGLSLGDFILKIDNQTFKEEKEIQDYINSKTNQEIVLTIKRGKEEKEIKVVPKPADEVFPPELLKDKEIKRGVIGVSLAKIDLVKYPFYLAIFEAIKTTFLYFFRIISDIYLILKELIVHQKMVGELMGVVGIGTFIGEVYQIGFVYFLRFLAVISIAVAVFQLIPFPALDGGRLIFVLIEGIRKKPINRKAEIMIHNIGFILLLILMVFITYKDLMRLGEKLFK